MKKNDWFGLGISVLIHLVLFIGFSFIKVEAAEEVPLGFIEVDFGPLQDGRPVQRAPVQRPEAPTPEPDPEPVVEEETPPEEIPPEVATPVDLPDQETEILDDEKVQTPETDVIAPETRDDSPQEDSQEPRPESERVRPLGGGDPDGDSSDNEGDSGDGVADQKTAPFDIEGLNRVPVVTPLPAYNAQVTAVIAVRITVDPQGRVVVRIPLRKGDPQLEKAVMDALQRWRFNALPPNAPQENQTGVITFRFLLQ